MIFEDFWYVVCESKQLKAKTVLQRTVLDEWLVVFRGDDGKAVVLRDAIAVCTEIAVYLMVKSVKAKSSVLTTVGFTTKPVKLSLYLLKVNIFKLQILVAP